MATPDAMDAEATTGATSTQAQVWTVDLLNAALAGASPGTSVLHPAHAQLAVYSPGRVWGRPARCCTDLHASRTLAA